MIPLTDYYLDNVRNLDFEEIGLRIRSLRRARGYTQQELAEKIYKTESSIRKYEKGLVTIPLNVLIDIAEALDTNIYNFLITDLKEENAVCFPIEEKTKEINEDELIGYILRKTSHVNDLTYEEVRSVLEAKKEFLKEKGITYTVER